MSDKPSSKRYWFKALLALMVFLVAVAPFVYVYNYIFNYEATRYLLVPTCGDFHYALPKGNKGQLKHLLQQDSGFLERPCIERGEGETDESGEERTYWAGTPLQYAVWANSFNAVTFLVENGAAVDGVGVEGTTPLNLSIPRSSTKIAEYLIRHGANVNRPGVLHSAVGAQATETILLLLRSGADINAKGRNGHSPLDLAVSLDDNTAVVKLLLEHGADGNSQDEYENTPLHTAVGLGKRTNVAQLLAAGASCNVKNKWGQTPLHELASCTRDQAAIYGLLKSHGAPLNLKDNNGKTALDLAREYNNTEAVAALQQP